MNIKKKRCIAVLSPIAAVGLLFLIRPLLLRICGWLPDCIFHRITGYLCPGCGNTRSVAALLNFDIYASLKFNITPVILLSALILWYLEFLLKCFGLNVRLIPRSGRVNFAMLGILILYFVVRNFV